MRNFLTNFMLFFVVITVIGVLSTVGYAVHVIATLYGPIVTILVDAILLSTMMAGVLTFLEAVDG